jgi:hypothetical protein
VFGPIVGSGNTFKAGYLENVTDNSGWAFFEVIPSKDPKCGKVRGIYRYDNGCNLLVLNHSHSVFKLTPS